MTDLDYSTTGLTVQQAKVANAERYPDKASRPKTILWAGHRIQTSDAIRVAEEGVVRLEFISWAGTVRQGADMKIDDGWIELAACERIPLLRTWRDDRFEDVVEYPFVSRDGVLWTWNVFEMTYPNGKKIEERWTHNAGFWIETVSDSERIYHCSHGMAAPPDFDSLVFRITVRPSVMSPDSLPKAKPSGG